MDERRRCEAMTKAGTRCRAWAVRGSDPPRCVSHGGSAYEPGPPGNRNAEKHGVYSQAPHPASPRTRGEEKDGSWVEEDRTWGEENDLADLIADLERRIAQLSAYLDQVKVGNGTGGTATVDEYVRLVALHGQLCSRVGRLMRDQQQLRGEDDPELQAAMNQALDLAGEILGLEL